jgi:hypothetical protein
MAIRQCLIAELETFLLDFARSLAERSERCTAG